MRKIVTVLLFLIVLGKIHSTGEIKVNPLHMDSEISAFNPENIVDVYALNAAFRGYKYFSSKEQLQNDSILTIIDYSLPSNKKRLYILNIKSNKLIYSSLVSHGINSGKLIPNNFSNKISSNKSSLGFFITGETYDGKHGYSLRLHGTEKNINDNAFNRAVVIHGAEYSSNKFVDKHGMLGRSFGCPALPIENTTAVINIIKNGSLVFAYFPEPEYFSSSDILINQPY